MARWGSIVVNLCVDWVNYENYHEGRMRRTGSFLESKSHILAFHCFALYAMVTTYRLWTKHQLDCSKLLISH